MFRVGREERVVVVDFLHVVGGDRLGQGGGLGEEALPN
jgi:hypothetical protein